jgi:hypothetical protein
MTAPQFSPWFWPLVEGLGGYKAAMAQRFQAMPREQLLEFGREYERARSCIHPFHRQGMVLMDYRDDREGVGDVFAAWVVSRGQAFWDQVRRDPEAFQPAADEFERVADDFTDRRPDFIASSVFRDRFGEEMLFVL